MARIPVERDRKGSPWWLWLLGLLLIAGLAWLLISLFDPAETEQDVVEGEDQEMTDTTGMGTGTQGAITDIAMLFAAGSGGTLASREVDLESVQVADVVGDSTFFISNQGGTAMDAPPPTAGASVATDTTSMTGMADRILVLMEEREAQVSSVGPEGGIRVTSGKAYRIKGRTVALEESLIQNRGLGQEQMEQARQSGIIIHAQQVEEVTAPGGGTPAQEDNLP